MRGPSFAVGPFRRAGRFLALARGRDPAGLTRRLGLLADGDRARSIREILGSAPVLDRVLILGVAGFLARLVQVFLGGGVLVGRVAVRLRELRRRDRRRRLVADLADVLDGAAAQ